MDRHQEVEGLLLNPVVDLVRTLSKFLNYEPPLFTPGQSAVQSISQTQVWIVTEMTPASNEAATVGNTMRTGTGTFTISVSVPDRMPNLPAAHARIKTEIAKLTDLYKTTFHCNVDQLYLDDVTWLSQVEVSNRTQYMVRLNYRYHEYPNRRRV